MASYFDVGADADMVSPDVRSAQDLSIVAAQVEADVIRFYTKKEPDAASGWRENFPEGVEVNATLGLYVYLAGYDVDADAADMDLVTAMKATIADVTVWRLHQNKLGPNVLAKSDGLGGQNRKGKEFRTNANDKFPADWDWRLRPFSTRDVTSWVI
jgi:hypothetical protein